MPRVAQEGYGRGFFVRRWTPQKSAGAVICAASAKRRLMNADGVGSFDGAIPRRF